MVRKVGYEGRTQPPARGRRKAGKVASIRSIQPVTTPWHDCVEPLVAIGANKVGSQSLSTSTSGSETQVDRPRGPPKVSRSVENSRMISQRRSGANIEHLDRKHSVLIVGRGLKAAPTWLMVSI